jgi:mRNA interferase MazF
VKEEFNRGEIVLVDLNPARGAEKRKKRPFLIIQNDIGNKFSPLTIVAVITSQKEISKKFPTDVWVDKGKGGLDYPSIIQCDQVRTVDKRRIIKKVGIIDESVMEDVDKALKISLDLL